MGFADILDGAFQLYRASAATIVALTLILLVPLQLLVAFLQRDSLLQGGLAGVLQDPTTAEALAGGIDDIVPAAIGFALTQGLFVPLLTGGYIGMATIVTQGGQASLADAWGVIRRRGPGLLAGWWLHVLAYGIVLSPVALFLLAGGDSIAAAVLVFPISILGSVALVPLFIMVAPAIVVEGIGPIRAVRRSVRLARQRYFALFGLMLGSAFVIGLLATLLGGIAEVAAFLSGLGYAWVLLAAATTISALIAGPLTAHVALLAFLDARVRLEGHDLVTRARRLREVGPDLAG